MAIDSRYKMSQERLDTLKEELHYLETTREKEVAELIKEARSFGDLSENSEYDEAKTEQGKLYSRIAEITDLIENAEVVEKVEVAADVVTIGSHVRVLDVDEDAEEEYTIVGSQEANPMEGCISDDSPFGFALKGHKVGETVTVTVNGTEIYLETKRSTSLSHDTDILVTEKPQSAVSAPFTILKTNGIIEDTEASLSPGAYLFMTEHESIRLDFDERGTYTVYGG